MSDYKIIYLKYSITLECSLKPDFVRVLAPDGAFLWNHYAPRGISLQKFFEWYQLSDKATFQGVSDGFRDGLQIQLTQSEFRRVADCVYDGFRFWKFDENVPISEAWRRSC